MTARKRILFLCTGNSCRSQMAEGFLRHLYGDRFESLSAGAKPAGYVHPRAVTVMAECGIDISMQASKSIHDFVPPGGTPPDVVIGVCSTADKNCPVFPANVERRQWPFDDPFIRWVPMKSRWLNFAASAMKSGTESSKSSGSKFSRYYTADWSRHVVFVTTSLDRSQTQ